VPLVALAIPSIAIGWMTAGPVVFGDFFVGSIAQGSYTASGIPGGDYHGPVAFLLHSFSSPVVYLALAGIVTAWYLYLKRPELPAMIAARFARLHRLLVNKYYFDWFNENVIAPLARGLGTGLWKGGDQAVIDGIMVDGSARGIGWVAGVVRHVQSGYLYHYAFAMIIGLCALVAWLLLR